MSVRHSIAVVAAVGAFVASASVAKVDFEKDVGKVNPALHSSGWTPRSTNCSQKRNPDVDIVKSMNFKYARTHDWALVNEGQRAVDLHFVFPLAHLDPKDPKNYCFGPTDHLLGMSRDAGLEIFYRLGTSIEHTGERVHFNSLIPADFDKTAEVFAGIVRHYNRGWADGKKWNIRYWEIWNEPDGWNNMWCCPEGDTPENAAYRHKSFAEFFVTCLKRIKSEFPEVKVGGPALCSLNVEYFQLLFDACRKAGVAPDFISWHYYGNDPSDIARASLQARELCDRNGFKDCELVVNEWHYLDSTWQDLRSANPAVAARAERGPAGHNNIDSAAFLLGNLIQFQTASKLDIACYYGCGHSGHWGYMDEGRQFNKVYYACRLFGGIVRNYPVICSATVAPDARNYYVLAVRNPTNGKKGLLVVDYRNTDQVVDLEIEGLGEARNASAVVLDDARDALPCTCSLMGNRLRLVKQDKYSGAFFVTFE